MWFIFILHVFRAGTRKETTGIIQMYARYFIIQLHVTRFFFFVRNPRSKQKLHLSLRFLSPPCQNHAPGEHLWRWWRWCGCRCSGVSDSGLWRWLGLKFTSTGACTSCPWAKTLCCGGSSTNKNHLDWQSWLLSIWRCRPLLCQQCSALLVTLSLRKDHASTKMLWMHWSFWRKILMDHVNKLNSCGHSHDQLLWQCYFSKCSITHYNVFS